MSQTGILIVGVVVFAIVLLAVMLLMYAAVLDGRDRRLATQPPEFKAGTEADPGWTFPPHEEREVIKPRRPRRRIRREPGGATR